MDRTIANIKAIPILEGFSAQFIHTDNVTLSFIKVKAGSILPLHSHIHEQITQITAGEFELTIANTTKRYKPGMIAIIPSNVPHSGIAITDCTITDIFTPVREDYKALS